MVVAKLILGTVPIHAGPQDKQVPPVYSRSVCTRQQTDDEGGQNPLTYPVVTSVVMRASSRDVTNTRSMPIYLP
jgi:hypothetical protein